MFHIVLFICCVCLGLLIILYLWYIFSSRDALIGWVRDIGKRNGLVIVTLTSDNGAGGRAPRLKLGWERGGKYRDRRKNKEKPLPEGKGRQTGTKKCECPFLLKGLRRGDGWVIEVSCGVHNHPAANSMEGHSFAGRLSTKETDLLLDMSKSLVKPK